MNKQIGDSRYCPLHYAMLYVNVECVSLLVGANAGKFMPTVPSPWSHGALGPLGPGWPVTSTVIVRILEIRTIALLSMLDIFSWQWAC